MKILQIFGAVVAVHLLAFIFIFASPGCQSGPHTMPTPDATVPSGSAPVTFNTTAPQPVDLGTPTATYTPAPAYGHASPTRPGSAAAVAVTPAKAVENVAPVSTYTVERGDSLWSIAKKNGMTVAELAKANSISTGTALKPGRKLIVPGKLGGAKEPVATAAMSLPAEKTAMPNRPSNGETVRHLVVSGESLGVIAKKYGVTVGELAAANNLQGPTIRAGQHLIIPGYKPVAGKSSSSSAAKPAASTPASSAPAQAAAPAPTPDPAVPKFEIAPPPPGQDLDAGLKSADTEVPTIKVEDPAPAAK